MGVIFMDYKELVENAMAAQSAMALPAAIPSLDLARRG